MPGDHHLDPAELIGADRAAVVAELMKALATPSRLRILGALCAAPRTVGDLADALGMEPSAVSHQLRVLRHLRLVVAERSGRSITYRPHDHHVGPLLVQAMSHTDHTAAAVAAPVGREEAA